MPAPAPAGAHTPESLLVLYQVIHDRHQRDETQPCQKSGMAGSSSPPDQQQAKHTAAMQQPQAPASSADNAAPPVADQEQLKAFAGVRGQEKGGWQHHTKPAEMLLTEQHAVRANAVAAEVPVKKQYRHGLPLQHEVKSLLAPTGTPASLLRFDEDWAASVGLRLLAANCEHSQSCMPAIGPSGTQLTACCR